MRGVGGGDVYLIGIPLLYAKTLRRRGVRPRGGERGSFLESRGDGRRCPAGEKWRSWGGGVLTWPRLEREPPLGGAGLEERVLPWRWRPSLLTWTWGIRARDRFFSPRDRREVVGVGAGKQVGQDVRACRGRVPEGRAPGVLPR